MLWVPCYREKCVQVNINKLHFAFLTVVRRGMVYTSEYYDYFLPQVPFIYGINRTQIVGVEALSRTSL